MNISINIASHDGWSKKLYILRIVKTKAGLPYFYLKPYTGAPFQRQRLVKNEWIQSVRDVCVLQTRFIYTIKNMGMAEYHPIVNSWG